MKFNKGQLRAVIALATVFAVYNILAFVLPFKHTGLFWVGYSFGLVSIIVSVLILITAFGSRATAKSRFYGFPIARVGVIYAAAQIPLSFLAMALAAIEQVPTWPFVLLFLLILAAAILGTVATDMTRDEVERQDAKLVKDVTTIRALRSLGNSLVANCNDENAKKELQKLSDTLNYCDPVSNAATAETEAELKTIMEELQRSLVDGNNEAIIPLCKKASFVLSERNRLCKLNK